MKTLSNISATNCGEIPDVPAPVSSPQIAAMLTKIKITPRFMRQHRMTANGFIFESTSGANVFVSKDELYKMVEFHEPLFCVPKTVDDKKN